MARITAISTLGWAHYTLYQALPGIKKMGFKNVEIASFCKYAFHFNYGSPTVSELKNMAKELDLRFIHMHYSPDRYYGWERNFEEKFYNDCEKKLKQLPELGIKKMTMVSVERNDRDDLDMQFDRLVLLYDDIAEMAKKYGVMMIIEVPHLYSIMYKPELVFRVLDKLKSDNIGVLVDSSHWGIIRYDINEYLEKIGKRLQHVHLRDSKGDDTGDRKQMLEFTPGDGNVDFAGFGEALDRIGYHGDVSIEFEYRGYTLDQIEDEYMRGFSHLKKCGWIFPEEVNVI